MGAQALKTHNKRVIDVISKVITLMQQYFLLAERVQVFIKKSHQSLAFSLWRVSTSFLNSGADLTGLTAPGPDPYNLATQQEQCCQSETPLALIPKTSAKGEFCLSVF